MEGRRRDAVINCIGPRDERAKRAKKIAALNVKTKL